jgi:hypothetical protein
MGWPAKENPMVMEVAIREADGVKIRFAEAAQGSIQIDCPSEYGKGRGKHGAAALRYDGHRRGQL